MKFYTLQEIYFMKEREQKDQNSSAETGNASNPSPLQGMEPRKEQLIDEKGEKYLREVANIEDLPDAVDQEEMDQAVREKE